jgi:FkbM family methyltransferase
MGKVQTIFNYFPPFKGKLRLAKLFITNKKSERDFITPKGVRYCLPNLEEVVSLELYVNGVYEKDTIEFICNSIPYNGVFIDVGANIGAICLEVAIARPDIRVYAFEASPKVFIYLKKNKEQNNTNNLYIFNLAIHEENNIDLPFYSPLNQNGKGSFSPVFTDIPELVKTIRLDGFINNNNILPNLIKVDVEGYELLVFKSLSNFIHLNKTTFLFEFVDWAEDLAKFKKGSAQAYLLQQGYELTSFPTGGPILKEVIFGSEMIFSQKVNYNII